MFIVNIKQERRAMILSTFKIEKGRKGEKMLNKTMLIKDAIIVLEKDKDPLLGSIQYELPTKPNILVTIQTDNLAVQIPLNQIELIVFKYDAKTFCSIFNGYLFSTKENFNEWNETSKNLASHELHPNF